MLRLFKVVFKIYSKKDILKFGEGLSIFIIHIISHFNIYSIFQQKLERFRFGFQYLYRYLNLPFSQSDVPDLSRLTNQIV